MSAPFANARPIAGTFYGAHKDMGFSGIVLNLDIYAGNLHMSSRLQRKWCRNERLLFLFCGQTFFHARILKRRRKCAAGYRRQCFVAFRLITTRQLLHPHYTLHDSHFSKKEVQIRITRKSFNFRILYAGILWQLEDDWLTTKLLKCKIENMFRLENWLTTKWKMSGWRIDSQPVDVKMEKIFPVGEHIHIPGCLKAL